MITVLLACSPQGGGGGVLRWSVPVIGSVLDKYEVLQKIGEGGMATVYRGRHTTLGRDVAIKVLHPHLSAPTGTEGGSPEARVSKTSTMRTSSASSYSGTDAEDCYIVTEFVDGATLSPRQRTGQVPSEVSALIGARLAGRSGTTILRSSTAI